MNGWLEAMARRAERFDRDSKIRFAQSVDATRLKILSADDPEAWATRVVLRIVGEMAVVFATGFLIGRRSKRGDAR